MLVVISPAKIQNINKLTEKIPFTQPQFIDEAEQLIHLIRDVSQSEISRMFDINSNLTALNFDRYFNWHRPFTLKNAKQAMFVFDGEVYRGLNPTDFSKAELEYAQRNLRIFSGLYGILRPLDLIQPYRLEVSTKLNNKFGNDLYAFWKEKVTKSVVESLKLTEKPQIILNLASSEYIKTIDSKNLNIIDIEFFEVKDDKLKQIVVYTKKARGQMARFVIKNRITNPEDLKGFSDGGYWFSPQNSTENKYVFTR